jgi:outer membrane receptor protein involved in Fe transport
MLDLITKESLQLSKIIWVLLIIYILTSFLFSQDVFIAGEIRNKKTEELISDVNIYLIEHSLGTTSDEYGQFYLKIPTKSENITVVFHHIAFDTLQVSLRKVRDQRIFYLNPSVMTSDQITVMGRYEEMDIARDLPQMTIVFDEKKFKNQAYTDAGDLLKTEQSIQIDEDLSGKKTIAIRGGNADDVIILYNGVKLNNPYDNTFDLSLINLDDVKQVEVIKGNNTSLYGSDAFSGVVNIVPKVNNDYTVRFAQRFGTYDSGDWNLQLNHSFKNKLHVLYSHKEGGSRRTYADSPDESEFLENKSSHQMASMVYSISDKSEHTLDNNISAMYMRTKLSYRNNRYYEGVLNLNQLASLRYVGDLGIIKNVNLVGSYQWFDHDQQIPTPTGLYRKYFDNQNMKLNIEKTFTQNIFSLLIGYQFESSDLDFKEERNYLDDIAIGLESVFLTRERHGLVSIFKLQTLTGSDNVRTADIDVSFRYDNVKDEQHDLVLRNEYNELDYLPGLVDENNWEDTMLKISTHFAGSFKDFGFNAYINFGNNYKFPSLFQQLSSPAVVDERTPEIINSLQPEKNKSTELGFEMIHEVKKVAAVDNWEINLSYFNNLYENKFRMFYSPGNPIAFFDNVANAHISGIEGRFKIEFYRNIFIAEIGASQYFISDKAAFPFKSDSKYILNLIADYNGFFFRFHGFVESGQKGWFRGTDALYSVVDLPGFKNIDLILGKSFNIYDIKFITNFTVRNLLDDDTQIFGLSIRDRRFYILFGVEI